MVLIKNNIVIGNLVVPENILSFWARRVHDLRVSEARKVNRDAKEDWEGGERGSHAIVKKKRSHHRSIVAREASTGTVMLTRKPVGDTAKCHSMSRRCWGLDHPVQYLYYNHSIVG